MKSFKHLSYEDACVMAKRRYGSQPDYTPPATRNQAHKLLSDGPPSKEQFGQAKDLGVTLPASTTYNQAQEILRSAFIKASRIEHERLPVGTFLLFDEGLWRVSYTTTCGERAGMMGIQPVRVRATRAQTPQVFRDKTRACLVRQGHILRSAQVVPHSELLAYAQ